MFTIFPIVSFVLFFLILYNKINLFNGNFCWRKSFLLAATFYGLLLTASTELLSVFNLITFGWVLGIWISITLSVFLVYCIYPDKKTNPAVKFKTFYISRSEILALSGIVFIAGAIGLIALTAPPNNWDSMTYHMSRVFHWIQNHNVNHYPTHIIRQLQSTPWAEFVIMHFQILTGGDRLAKLVQWFSMLGSIIGVSLIAKLLGTGKRGQIFSAVICATIPMGILQGSSTQNDYVVAFWLVCFIYYMMELKKQPSNNGYAVVTGISLGLALLTKVTAYLYAFPFLLWFGFFALKNFKIKALKSFTIIAIFVFLINGGHYMRNYEMFRHSLGETATRDINMNSIVTPSSIASNVVRNVGLHCGTPSKLINVILSKGIEKAHKILNIDVNDPRTTFSSTKFGIWFSRHEDGTGNFAHLLFGIAVMCSFLFSKRKKGDNDVTYYAIAVMAAFLLLCVFIKWNPWNSRYHLPLFVLGAPFVARAFPDINNPFKKNRILLISIYVISLCMVLGLVLYNYFGHKLIEAMYTGESGMFLNKMITGEATHSLEYYVKIANIQFLRFLGSLFIFSLILFSLYRFRDIVISISLTLLLLSLPWVLHNDSRKLIGEQNIFTLKRGDQYFSNRPGLKDPYIGAVDYIKSKGYSDIGIILSGDSWEYPFIALLQKSPNQPIRIEHVNVENESSIKYKIYPFNDFNPSAIILVSDKQNDKIVNKNILYAKEWSSDGVSIFIKQ